MARKLAKVECTCCGKTFEKRAYFVTEKNFCNAKCFGKWRTKPKITFCETCDKEFEKVKREQRFCSVTCAASRPRKARSGGKAKPRTENVQKNIAKKGWNSKCMIVGCEYDTCLDNHRITEGQNGGTYNIDNVCVLCPNHHSEVHRLNKKIVKIKEFEFELE